MQHTDGKNNWQVKKKAEVNKKYPKDQKLDSSSGNLEGLEKGEDHKKNMMAHGDDAAVSSAFSQMALGEGSG